MYPATTVARFLVNYCASVGKPISNLKLQKMLYFLWVGFYKCTGKQIFSDDICAWQFGPVVPSVYYEYCSHAGNPIREQASTTCISESDQHVIIECITPYIDIPASMLVEETHAAGSPWDIIYDGGIGSRRKIPFSLISQLGCDSSIC